MSNNNLTKKDQLMVMTLTALFIALTYVFTALINIKLPLGNGGLIHLGNVPLFICAIILGRKSGAIAGGIGMALFDLLSGWVSWAPFTLVIVALMGYSVGAIVKNRHKIRWYVVAFVVALLIKIVGYYLAELILYKNAIAPLASIPGNILQVMAAAIVVIIIIKPIEIASKKAGIKHV